MRRELEAWGRSLSAAEVSNLDQVSAALSAPEPFSCLTFHDACPVNRVVTSAGVRAIDFEMADFRHPLIDGAYAAISHLRCSASRLRQGDGLAFPPSVRTRAVEVYREAIVAGYPEYAEDGRFHHDLSAATAVWMVEILRRNRPRVADDRPRRFFGVTACQRVIATLSAFSPSASNRQRLPHLVEWAEQLENRLRSEWPAHPPLSMAAGLI
jgi:hypothetical protein